MKTMNFKNNYILYNNKKNALFDLIYNFIISNETIFVTIFAFISYFCKNICNFFMINRFCFYF